MTLGIMFREAKTKVRYFDIEFQKVMDCINVMLVTQEHTNHVDFYSFLLLFYT